MIQDERLTTWAAFVRFLRAPLQVLRSRRVTRQDAEEEAWLKSEAEKSRTEGGDPIPWEQVKRDLGL
jgi:uncharacterized protein with von Willebrand factor type A (vWA) domain